MSMPEAPVHKHACPVLAQHQIGMPWQPLVIQSVSESSLPQPLAHNQLRLRVLRPNRRHILTALLGREFIHCFPVSAGKDNTFLLLRQIYALDLARFHIVVITSIRASLYVYMCKPLRLYVQAFTTIRVYV